MKLFLCVRTLHKFNPLYLIILFLEMRKKNGFIDDMGSAGEDKNNDKQPRKHGSKAQSRLKLRKSKV